MILEIRVLQQLKKVQGNRHLSVAVHMIRIFVKGTIPFVVYCTVHVNFTALVANTSCYTPFAAL